MEEKGLGIIEDKRRNLLFKISELEAEASKLSDIHYIKSRELEILRIAKQLLEFKHSSSPFLNPDIMDRDFLERKIREYTEETERLRRKIHRLMMERDRLIDQLKRL